MEKMRKMLDGIRNEAISYIKELMGKLCVDSLQIADFSPGESPIVHEDPYGDDNNTFTLDRIDLNDDGTLSFDSSSCWGNGTDGEDALDIDTLVGIVDWLKDEEDDIYEEYNEGGVLATTAKGTKVCLCFVDDCEDNEGGFFVEVYEYPGTGDYFDYFCIHKEDCDCKDMNAVEEFAKKYISEITNY